MKTKICSKCGIQKTINEFSIEKKGKYGVRKDCKICRKKYSTKYKKIHFIDTIFNNINSRCNNKDNKIYGKKGIKNNLSKENLYFLWKRDKASKMKKPSVDRINTNKNYTLKNCQFLEMGINRIKDRLKPIIQYDLDGNFIREWKSAKEVKNNLNIDDSSIRKCCNKIKGHYTVNGFIWKNK